MKDSTMMGTGIIGAIIAALCCFTPILVVLLAAVGLSALTGYLDVVVIPALMFFVGLTVYAAYRRTPLLKGASKQ